MKEWSLFCKMKFLRWFSDKCTIRPQNDLDKFKAKSTHVCISHTPLRLKFLSVLLYNELFLSYRPILREDHQITQTWSWHAYGQRHQSRCIMCSLHTPRRLKILSVSLYDQPLIGYRVNLRQVQWMIPKGLSHVQLIFEVKVPMCIHPWGSQF